MEYVTITLIFLTDHEGKVDFLGYHECYPCQVSLMLPKMGIMLPKKYHFPTLSRTCVCLAVWSGKVLKYSKKNSKAFKHKNICVRYLNISTYIAFKARQFTLLSFTFACGIESEIWISIVVMFVANFYMSPIREDIRIFENMDL